MKARFVSFYTKPPRLAVGRHEEKNRQANGAEGDELLPSEEFDIRFRDLVKNGLVDADFYEDTKNKFVLSRLGVL